ncbi:hypothetical protein T4A_8890 [Trichinella pseudospiralis]|uniref:Uncharacterized protein n=1 Tax=Trichinella pseudospiralis TaxID=6337 RepID=A0A0V1DC47_TRIPS|nr:hypothetical protein T4A_8890 [Trichinella pseudospiralis]
MPSKPVPREHFLCALRKHFTDDATSMMLVSS